MTVLARRATADLDATLFDVVNPYLLVLVGAGATALGQFLPTFEARGARRDQRQHALDDRLYADARTAYIGAVTAAQAMTARLARTVVRIEDPAGAGAVPPEPASDIDNVEPHVQLAIFGSDEVAERYGEYWKSVGVFNKAVKDWTEHPEPATAANVKTAYGGLLHAQRELGRAARSALTAAPAQPSNSRWPSLKLPSRS